MAAWSVAVGRLWEISVKRTLPAWQPISGLWAKDRTQEPFTANRLAALAANDRIDG